MGSPAPTPTLRRPSVYCGCGALRGRVQDSDVRLCPRCDLPPLVAIPTALVPALVF